MLLDPPSQTLLARRRRLAHQVPRPQPVAVITQIVLHADPHHHPPNPGPAALGIAQQPPIADEVVGDGYVKHPRRQLMRLELLFQLVRKPLVFLDPPAHGVGVPQRKPIPLCGLRHPLFVAKAIRIEPEHGIVVPLRRCHPHRLARRADRQAVSHQPKRHLRRRAEIGKPPPHHQLHQRQPHGKRHGQQKNLRRRTAQPGSLDRAGIWPRRNLRHKSCQPSQISAGHQS